MKVFSEKIKNPICECFLIKSEIIPFVRTYFWVTVQYTYHGAYNDMLVVLHMFNVWYDHKF